MKTAFDILTILYDVLNVEQVTYSFDGEVFRHKRPEEREGKTDIVLVPLGTLRDFVQVGMINVNVFAPNLPNNAPDEVTLDQITKDIVTEIESYNATSEYINFIVESHDPITDDRDVTFVNIRVEYHSES